MATNRRLFRQRLGSAGGLPGRQRVRVIGSSGAAVGILLVVLSSALAIILSSSTSAHTTLPQDIQIQATTATAPKSSTTMPSTSTSVPPTSTTGMPATTTTSSVATSIPLRTVAPSSSDSGKTTVVNAVPTVRIEDNRGNQVADEGSEARSGASDDKKGANN